METALPAEHEDKESARDYALSIATSSSSASVYPDDELLPPPLAPPPLPSRSPSPSSTAPPALGRVSTSFRPPPKRTVAPQPRKKQTWGEWGTQQGALLASKGLVVTDYVGGQLNDISEFAGAERWFPTTGDFPADIAKCTRILESFTIDGVATEATKDGKKGAVMRKIPAELIRGAKGIAVYSAMRNGFPPFGGSNGAGLVVSRLPDGSWSAPSSVSPNQSTAGFMFGVDIFDAVIIIRTEEALLSFTSRAKFTLGSDVAIAAGPYGAGAALDVSGITPPLLSYVRSRGFYLGLHLSGQVFVERAAENEKLYYHPGIRAADILEGKIRIPDYAREHFSLLHQALYNAETGAAQRAKGGKAEEFSSFIGTSDFGRDVELVDGETLRLPPTPEEIDLEEKRLREVEEAAKRRSSWFGWAGARGTKGN